MIPGLELPSQGTKAVSDVTSRATPGLWCLRATKRVARRAGRSPLTAPHWITVPAGNLTSRLLPPVPYRGPSPPSRGQTDQKLPLVHEVATFIITPDPRRCLKMELQEYFVEAANSQIAASRMLFMVGYSSRKFNKYSSTEDSIIDWGAFIIIGSVGGLSICKESLGFARG